MIEKVPATSTPSPRTQPDEGVTYAAKIDKSEARLDFLTSAVQVERQVRAFNPMPGAFFELDGERYKILAAEVVHPADTVAGATPGVTLDDALTIACNPGAIRAVRVQRAGSPRGIRRIASCGRAIPQARYLIPFASSEVEMPIGHALLRGVSTSLDTKAKGLHDPFPLHHRI